MALDERFLSTAVYLIDHKLFSVSDNIARTGLALTWAKLRIKAGLYRVRCFERSMTFRVADVGLFHSADPRILFIFLSTY